MIKNETEHSNVHSETAIAENIRAKDAAKYLGVGLSTVWLYAKQGKITPIKLSERVTIFKRSELDTFINASVEEVA